MCHASWAPRGRAHATVDEVGIDVEGGQLPAWVHAPPESVPAIGACVLATDIYGPVPFYREVARRLAEAGVATALVDLLFREGPLPEVTREAAFARRGRMDERRALADSHAAVEHMAVQAGGGPVAYLGFCLGGMLALDLAAERDDIVAISFYGFPEGIQPQVAAPAPRPIDVVGDVVAPVLAHWPDLDHIVDPAAAARYDAAMVEHGRDYTSHHYPDAGHSFLQGIVEDRDDSAAAHLAWDRTLDFLRERLPG